MLVAKDFPIQEKCLLNSSAIRGLVILLLLTVIELGASVELL